MYVFQAKDLQKNVKQQWKELKSKLDKFTITSVKGESARTVLYLDCRGGYADLYL